MRLGIAFVVATAVLARAQGPPAPATSGLIVGQVIDATSGRPISGAVVTIAGGSMLAERGLNERVLTTSDGRFVFRDLRPASYSITATKPGYPDGAAGRRRPGGPSSPIALGDGEKIGDVVVRMWRYGSISGTVVDEAGEPLVGVAVRAFERGVSRGTRRLLPGPAGMTDDRGTYRLGNLVAGEYVVAVVTFSVSMPTAMLAELSENRRLMVPEIVSIMRPGTTASLQIGDATLAVPPGIAAPVPAGDHLFVYATTFYPATASPSQATSITVGSGEERSAVDFQLRPVPTVKVSGVITGTDTPQMFPLRLLPADVQEGVPGPEGTTAAPSSDGTFIFPAVPTGQYTLRTTSTPRVPQRAADAPDNILWAEMPLAVGANDVTGVTVALQQGLRISGRFEFDGTRQRPTGPRLEQVPISIEPADSFPDRSAIIPTPPARVDGNGNFTTIGLPPGRYFIRVLGSPEGWMFKSAMFNGRDAADTPLELQGADATGVVVTFTDRWTGIRGSVAPVGGKTADAIVLLFPTDSQSWTNYGMNVRRIKSAKTSRTGEYSFRSIPPGDYYLIAIADEQAGDWQDAKFLEALARDARHITIADGDFRVENLQLHTIR